jgi:hypothetical protein
LSIEFHGNLDSLASQQLPWSKPLNLWGEILTCVEDAPKGLSRHTVLFLNINGELLVLKEEPIGLVEKEYQVLTMMTNARLPVITPIGYAVNSEGKDSGILVTRYLEGSLPYRNLFMQNSLVRYREHLLDAVSGLLVQIHLAGFFWGDCSLSNTLFRKDAGTLQAYVVDVETAETTTKPATPLQRFEDLKIMELNVTGDLDDLRIANLVASGISITETASYIRLRYQRLWEEVAREETLLKDETYKIQDKIRRLNELGFSVNGVDLSETNNGQLLRLKIHVTDRNFHHDQLFSLTGLDAQERQARQMMNEIQELKARLSNENNRSMSMSVTSYLWLESIYKPTLGQISIQNPTSSEAIELYCQILEHKWFLSERERRDVGHAYAASDYWQNIMNANK